MYRSKKDIDKHVESLTSKLSLKEFQLRAYSVARLYFEVGDYASCQKYVQQYLGQKDNNAAAYKLLGQALHKLGKKEQALDQYKTSLDIDPTQISLILDICELLTNDDIIVDPGRAKYWCEKAEATFPKHPVTFQLREKLMTMSNPDPEALIHLLTSELAVRPKDVTLHARLLKYYVQTNRYKEAFDHGFEHEFVGNSFMNNFAWYETIGKIIKHHTGDIRDWRYQLLLLTVKERLCALSLTETPHGNSKGLVESSNLLHEYDQSLSNVVKAGSLPGHADFHTGLYQHHRGQLLFHLATFLLRKAKKDQLSWREATKMSSPLMLMAWHIVPLDTKFNWLTRAPAKQQDVVNRWYLEASYRSSQAGHYLLSNFQHKSHSYMDRISQSYSDSHWREKIYDKIFTSEDQISKKKHSHFLDNAFGNPQILRLPRKSEVEAYDIEAERLHPNSLHHFVWILSHYKNFALYKSSVFDMLTPKSHNYPNCGPETLNLYDVLSFLFCAVLTAQQNRRSFNYGTMDKPIVLPANITDLLCTLPQMKWWDCAYKLCQNELGRELTDIRATLSRGIEVVRCVDNHGLDPELLCILGRIFCEKGKATKITEEKNHLENRAYLYYSNAIPLLERLKNNMSIKSPEKRMFEYTHKDLNSKDIASLIEESKIFIGVRHFHETNYEKAIELLANLKSAEAFFHLSQVYKKMALDEQNACKDSTIFEQKSKNKTLLTKAKTFASKTLEMLKDNSDDTKQQLYSETQKLIESIEVLLSTVYLDLSNTNTNDVDGKCSSDENISSDGSHHLHIPLHSANKLAFHNMSSTPKHANVNTTKYRSAVDSQIFENTQIDHKVIDEIENQIKDLQKRDSTINTFMEQTKSWIDENRNIGNKIISCLSSNTQNTIDQFKTLKLSIDQIKEQIGECRDECRDVGELRKQVAELKIEINKLKKSTAEKAANKESDLYNLDDNYKSNENASTFTAQLPFTPPVITPFNQRLVPPFPVPPGPYLYGQNLYNLYNQYSQFAQPAPVPGTSQMFDPSRTPINYPGIYRTPEEMYADMAHLIPPTVSPSVSLPQPIVSNVTIPVTRVAPSVQIKDSPRSLPVNVVITSSDPLPTCTTTPAPILSVTIPPEHIKGIPHNYQIPMPSTNDLQIKPPIFGASPTESVANTTTGKVFSIWNQPIFKTIQSSNVTPTVSATVDVSKLSIFDPPKSGGVFSCPVSVANLNTSATTPNKSLNKSRTLSEKSNTSIDNYDPCPDFKPIIPLPDEVKVTTGEEDESVVFSARAKLFRFADKQWKERGIGEMKLLKHNVTAKVRVLMRREQVHKICANHIITNDIEIQPMKNETKAYFWVANDFADETVILEKFCIRFKSSDIANQFYEAFIEAQKNAKSSTEKTPKKEKVVTTKAICKSEDKVDSDTTKTVVCGFTFSGTPTIKAVRDDDKTEKSKETKTTVPNPFSNLTFNTASSPVSNVFNTATASPSKVISSVIFTSSGVQDKINTSDTVDEFEPTLEFQPVVPLPALVDHKTGEENDLVLFEQRAKLLRFDAPTKEWKERGLGNMKVLAQKNNTQRVRLLMRREQVMKVCCNHMLTIDMMFRKMPNVDKAVTWCAKDFSEGTLTPETFCLRFKSVQVCDDFINVVKTAQSKMQVDTKAAKEEKNSTQQNNQTGFGDKFKAKPGSWHCDACYTNNLESFANCACCEQPRPSADNKDSNNEVTTSWGDLFKPKTGSWECKECLIRNESNLVNCSACNSPKDSTAPKKDPKSIFGGSTIQKFTFGIPNKTENIIEEAKKDTVVTSGWGDKFKPKPGSWECKECFVRNESNLEQCSSCNNSKNPSIQANKAQSSIFTGTTSGSQFIFGVPKINEKPQEKPQTTVSSIFDGTGTHKFTFGIQSSLDKDIPKTGLNFDFGSDNKAVEDTIPDFGMISTVKSVDVPVAHPLNFSVKKAEDSKRPTIKPALLPTPEPEKSAAVSSFASKENSSFNFLLKSKTPPKGKSPRKASRSDEDGDENEYVSEDEGHHIHFSPVIPMPDKIEVITGEENEIELYAQRAKLFRFIMSEWKERGVGIVKILKHKESAKLRVVMRREQVLKICLNHALNQEITYTPKDPKTWLFAANDFSEGTLCLQQFCLRFQTKEIAADFKNSIDNALNSQSNPVNVSDSEDVVFVNEIQATAEDKKKANELMLPENFFTYKSKKDCPGCRGCIYDDEKGQSCVTPVKISTPPVESPTNSIYGTPVTMNRTIDTTIFRTPMETIGQNINKAAINNKSTITPVTNKQDTITPKGIFSGFAQEKSLTAEDSSVTVSSLLGNTLLQTPTSTKVSILAAPKLSTSNTSQDNENAISKTLSGINENKPSFDSSTPSTNKYIFGTAIEGDKKSSGSDSKISLFGLTAKPVFGATKAESKPITFGVATEKESNNDKTETTSIFMKPNSEPLSIFSGAGQGNIFGTLKTNTDTRTDSSFGNSNRSVFSVNPLAKQLNIEKPVFGTENKGWSFGTISEKPKNGSAKVSADENKSVNTKINKAVSEVKSENGHIPEEKKETLFNIDNSISFAALSTAEPIFNQKKTDFKWEGAGEQLFCTIKSDQDNSSIANADENATEKENEEYDPHYEPIVPLPAEIVVTTGEEDEVKLFNQRCKLYRYDDNSKEWKERGVGEIKILHHPAKQSYRLLLRREQVHKPVLNMLLFMNFELLPMKNSDRAWTWAGRNYAEIDAGVQETLAIKFKTPALADAFKDAVTECVRKLQADAAQAIRQASESPANKSATLLRLPKHLEETARDDTNIVVQVSQSARISQPFDSTPTFTVSQSSGGSERNGGSVSVVSPGILKPQVHFIVPDEEVDVVDHGDEDEDYDQNYDYYEEHEESAPSYEYDCVAQIVQGDKASTHPDTSVQVFYCQEWCAPKILISDLNTGEIYADMLIDSETEFQVNDASVTWTGVEYLNNEPVEKTVTVTFADADTATQFYANCEEMI